MGKDTIKELTEREQARDKVSIWFGSKSNFLHPLREVLANSIDEINNNFNEGEITVILNGNKITVKDTGRGIPIGDKTNGKYNYELLLLKLFAGTNYDNNEHGKTATGTNGVGLTVTNYCSTYFSTTSYREDGIYKIEFINGGELKGTLSKEENNENITGTEISFILDEEVFGNYSYDLKEIESIVNKAAGVSNRIKFNFIANEVVKEFKYDNLKDYFIETTINNTCKEIVGLEKTYDLEEELNKIEIVLTTASEVTQETFLNITYLHEGGAIHDGIVNGIKLFSNKYCKEKKLIDKKLGSLSNSDIEESVSFICNLLSTKVEFANQTKMATQKTLYKKIAQDYIQEVLEIVSLEEPKNLEKFIKHILEVQKFNNKAQANKRALQKKLSEKVDSIYNRPEGLFDCKKYGAESELFIAEGKSALGSIVLARDAQFQAGIAVRGKITNCLKKEYDEIFKSEIVMDLIKIIGCGVDTNKKNKDLNNFSMDNLRYGKIIIATDMDADGFQIQCLLLTMFYKLTPKLIENGCIYIVNTPLYIITLKDDSDIYIYSEEEKEKYIEKNNMNDVKSIARAKGLGELDAYIMSKTGVAPKSRNITRVTVHDAKAMVDVFRIWMDTAVEERKKIIEERLCHRRNSR